jgi:hypothetical protein
VGGKVNFALEVYDADGAQQVYRYVAQDMDQALKYVPIILQQYGHESHQQTNIAVAQLVDDTDMSGAVPAHILKTYCIRIMRDAEQSETIGLDMRPEYARTMLSRIAVAMGEPRQAQSVAEGDSDYIEVTGANQDDLFTIRFSIEEES